MIGAVGGLLMCLKVDELGAALADLTVNGSSIQTLENDALRMKGRKLLVKTNQKD